MMVYRGNNRKASMLGYITLTLVIACSGSRLPKGSMSESNLQRSLGSSDSLKSEVRVKRQAAGSFSDLTPRECGFGPVNNVTFVESVYQYFSVESSTNILEYDVTVMNDGQAVDLESTIGPETYKPFRWYRTQGEGSSELLQVNQYYFGFIWRYMDTGLDKVKVTLNVTSPACLDNLPRGDMELLLTEYFLKDFNINPSSVEHPYVKAEMVEVCHMTIRNDNDWGKLTFKCCGFEDDILQCRDVMEDAWVWVLRAFIMAVTVLLFLYFPVILPRGYRIYDYAYYPPDGLQFNFLLTTRAERYRMQKDTQVFHPKDLKRMTQFRSSLANLKRDVVYTAHVRKLDVNVCADRLLQEDCSVINLRRSLFDTFVRCKIRHADPLEDCCKTNACGTYCLPGCPPWQAWLRAIRTVLVMAVLAVPALPFMYAQAGDGLEYQELDKAIEDRGLQRPFNFYVGRIFSKIVVGVLAFMYVLHTVIIMIDGATDGNIGRLYADVLDVSEKKGTIRKHMEKSQSCVKRVLRPVQRCGVMMVPVWLLALLAMPLYVVFDFFYRAPMIRVFLEGFKRLLSYSRVIQRKPGDEARTVCGMIEVYLFFLSIVFVFIVLGIGANFLVHVVAMVIVKVLVDAKLVYRVLPVALLLIIYIRDSFSRVAQTYSDFLAKVMTAMRAKEADDLRRESFKAWGHQVNKIFRILPETIEADPDDEVIQVKDKGEKDEGSEEKKEKKLFLLKNGGVRMRLGQLLVFLDKDDFLFTSKKFLFSCCTMDCSGAPGHLEDNYIRAAIDFLKIGFFLIFLFLVVMAYGNAYYISPNNQMFVTLISGMIPLVLRMVLLKRGAVETVKVDYRFESRLEEKIAAFCQSWQIQDISVKDVHLWGAAPPSEQTTSPRPITTEPESSPGVAAEGAETLATGSSKKPVSSTSRILHLVLDVSDDPGFLDTPPGAHHGSDGDSYSLQEECGTKDTGCCNWRSRMKQFVFCSCCKGDNSVAAGADDKAESGRDKNPGGPHRMSSRRRSSMNFFWEGDTGHPTSSDTRTAYNGDLHSQSQSHRGRDNNTKYYNNSNSGTTLRDFNPEDARYNRQMDDEDTSDHEEFRGRNHGRWKRQSLQRRETLKRARDEQENARAAMDAYLISNAVMNSAIAAETANSSAGYVGQRSEGNVSFTDPARGEGTGDMSEA